MTTNQQAYTAQHAQSYQDQSKRHQFVAGLALIKFAKFRENEHVFDLGCGTGELTYEIAKLIQAKGIVVAIDPDRERIAIIVKQESMEDYYFESLTDFLLWLEATTHGVFQVKQLSGEHFKLLQKQYQGKLEVFSDETLKLCLKKL